MKKAATSLAALTLMALMIPSAFACILPSYGKVTGGGHGKISSSPGIPSGSFGFNIRYYEGYSAPKGELDYVDHDSGMHVHGHTMTDLWVSEDKTEAWFSGLCTIDGVGGFRFRVDVVDNSEPGEDDHFGIMLFNGSDSIPFYEAGNTLLCGNIQIHAR